MSLPFIFANLAGDVPAADLDTNLNAVAAMGTTQTTATGATTIALVQNSNQPTIAAYANYLAFAFIAAGTSSGSVTVNVNSIGAVPLYLPDGITQAGSGDLVSGQYYEIVYNSALDTGLGGFVLINVSTISSGGSWIPTLLFGGAAVGMTGAFSGMYRKIGALVFVSFRIVLTNKGSSTGSASLTGLPFTSSSFSPGVLVGNANVTSWPVGTYALVNNGGTSISLRSNGTTGEVDLTNANFTNTSDIIGSAVYPV